MKRNEMGRPFRSLADVQGVRPHETAKSQDESPTHRNFSPESVRGSAERMLLIVDDPETVVARAITAGAREIDPVPTSTEASRLGRVEDPFGHHWEIGKPVTDWPPEN